MATIEQLEPEWSALLSLRQWMSWDLSVGEYVHIEDTLFQVGEAKYVFCVPYNERLEEVRDKHFITAVLWAGTEGAARRAALMQIEADDLVQSEPPRELLLPRQPRTYGEIVKTLRADKTGSFQETASYRLGKDGAFVHRNIIVPPVTFHFRNARHDLADPCYAITYRLG